MIKSKEETSVRRARFLLCTSGARTAQSAEMAARIGWKTVYSTLQLSRLRWLFERHRKGSEDDNGDTFDEWNRCRIEDGILCRDSDDCSWIDSNLYCDENELNFTPEVS